MAASVEAVCADFFLGQADGSHKIFDGAEFEAVEPEFLADLVDQASVALRSGNSYAADLLFF